MEIRLGADGPTLERIRGDKDHPASLGYTWEKALRLDHYQNGRGERVLHALRRREDGTFEEVDWETAVREVAARLGAVRDVQGADKILYYGGGGQANHLCGPYGVALDKVARPAAAPWHRRRVARSGSTAPCSATPCVASSTTARWPSPSARTGG